MNTNSEYITLDEEHQRYLSLSKRLRTMKILAIVFALLALTFASCTGFLSWQAYQVDLKRTIPLVAIINPTPDITVNHTITPDSAASYNGTANVKNSPYFPINNFYNGKITPTLRILKKFQTFQQSTSYSCGAAVGFMALRYLGLSSQFSEDDVAKAANTSPHIGTSTLGLATGLTQLTNPLEAEFDITFQEGDGAMGWGEFIKMINENIENDRVMGIANDYFGPHWQAIIGYDDMGTKETADDCLILADPYDTVDHNQDGYLVMSAERFFSTWTIQAFEEGHREQQFVTIGKKKGSKAHSPSNS